MQDWPAFLTQFLTEQKIDLILLYGDCRPVHQCVREQASRLGVEVGVFEAGYVRPGYITLEQGGINDYSSIPRRKKFFQTFPVKESSVPCQVGRVFWHAALWAVLYYLASSILKPLFPHYRHHRPLSVTEAWPWIRGLWRKYYYYFKERRVRQRLETDKSCRFFLVPLQVYYDSQMRVHSNFPSVESFIHDVVDSFAKNADPDVSLVIKHHPMDRAYRDYSQLCESLAEGYGLGRRLLYVHDLQLPSVLNHASGVVVVNSTVGLSALLHGVPVKVCGRAIYDIPNLTYSGRLKDFWREAPFHKPDPRALSGFRSYLIEHTQLNGSVYRKLSIEGSHAGIVWNSSLSLLNILTRRKNATTYISVQPESPQPSNHLGVSVVRYAEVRQRSTPKRATVQHY